MKHVKFENNILATLKGQVHFKSAGKDESS